ncbi:ABC transporter substrate-binding protein [Amycolatopsis pithecellobii]|uniref:ABC transporter substrate-binding protein n=1 Tax=Amycolatopsis pithecellobii TaxID=664692 RepID=UPI00140735B1|nr:ABC transporter substrate-binding protein [Amycolatopsis pithecellobii]
MITKSRAVLCAVAAAVGLTASACASTTASGGGAPDPNATMRVGLAIVNTQWDPALSPVTTDTPGLEMVYDRLFSQGADGSISGNLVQTWEFRGNDLVMHVRPGVKFQDGSPLDAQAVKVNLDRNRGATFPTSTLAAELSNIQSVTVTDPMTVTATLKKKDVSILPLLSSRNGMIVSAKALADKADLGTDPVGAGPWKLTSFQPGTGYTVERWDGYWNAPAVKVAKVQVSVLNSAQRLNAVRSGQLDMAILDTGQADSAKSSGLNVLASPLNTLTCFQVNNVTVPAYNDERVRQAINYAIDRPTIVKNVLAGNATPTSQIFPPTSIAFDKATPDPYPYDVAKAKALLAEAGYAGGFSFSAMFGTTPQAELEAIAGYLKAVNIDMKLVHIQGNDGVTKMWQEKSGQALFFPCNSVVDPSLAMPYFLPGNYRNPGNLTNADVTALAAQAQTIDDQAQRTSVLQRITHTISLHPLSIVPLYGNTATWVMNGSVTGFTVPPTNFWQLIGVGKSQ